MAIRTTIDRAGRVVLPKSLRDELQLEPGETIELERVGDQITLRPQRGAGTMRKKRGFWVFRSATPLTASVTDSVLEDVRATRDHGHMGSRK
ncbi:MAG: AbrB/MazE/SpoVT family DNA-binding domain-containing protein [Bryobacterales bacterium]|nr:AbrB/MazE/SpoVT family DNA-binding domain-containing protein [Bryobacterales bacterium]